MNKKLTSKYFRVLVMATNEEKDFATEPEALTWMSSVIHTYQDNRLRFVLTEITEKQIEICMEIK